MKNKEAVQALLALGQETRLNLFRLVVQKGQQGLTPGQMVEALGVPSPTLSFHLKELVSAGLLKVERQSRNLIYSPSADRIEALSAFLLENCCGGLPCSPGTLGKKSKKPKKRLSAASVRLAAFVNSMGTFERFLSVVLVEVPVMLSLVHWVNRRRQATETA